MTLHQVAIFLQWLSTVMIWAVAAHVMWPMIKHKKFNRELTPVLLEIEQRAHNATDPRVLLEAFNKLNKIWEKDKKLTNTANDMRIVGILAYIKGRWDQYNLQHGGGLSAGSDDERSFCE